MEDHIKKYVPKIQAYIAKMPSLPQTVTKVISICDNPNSSPSDLHRVISLDPVLTGQVLKLINSAYFFLPSQVVSLTQAIIMLGINTVKNLALSTAVLKSIGNKTAFKALDMNDFWMHSIGVGVTAKKIAKKIGIPKTEHEEFFVAGLLHDLGKIPLNDQFSEPYAEAIEMSRSNCTPLFKSETINMGINHLVVGKLIANKWKLTKALGDVLFYHHNVAGADNSYKRLCTVISIADSYVNINEIGSAGNRMMDLTPPYDLAESIGLSWQDLSDFKTEVFEEIENAKVFLQVADKG